MDSILPIHRDCLQLFFWFYRKDEFSYQFQKQGVRFILILNNVEFSYMFFINSKFHEVALHQAFPLEIWPLETFREDDLDYPEGSIH